MKTPANVVGRRLRRFLGALLVTGFGLTWWRLVPPVEAAVVKPAPAIALAREVVELRWSQTAHEPPPPRKPKVYRPRVVAAALPSPPLTPPPIDPIVIPVPTPDPDPMPDVVLTPIPEDEYLPIRTRSSR